MMERAADPWWIIGSAAVALLGADAGAVRDVDVLAGEGDIARLVVSGTAVRVTPAADDRFRSAIFATVRSTALPIELMGGLVVRDGRHLARIVPDTRVTITVDGANVHIPGRSEMLRILTLFGRPKDLRRAVALRRAAPIA